ncbi:AraC family transcriptional regulator [Variovorax sp. J22P240]|uniref:AraC family transcriptional regulator n=1 Tax=Variovorax sp. J22P240 TaxID=3053514 RepID=UPI0025751917|nr:AraC family transcriptional regulator [Variovorax sp. J22P240]MDM0000353.1 AraC family transcriptional regulator [Variovorax sp. J22P240]
MSQDTLSDVLQGVRLRGAVFFSISASSDWAAEAPSARELAPLLMRGVDHVIEYHAVAQGSCWAGIPGGPSVQLFAGDVVMFPHGDAHVVSSAPGMRGDSDFNWYADMEAERLPLRLAYNGQNVLRAALPDSEVDTNIVCGFLGCDLQPFNPLIESLPRMLHLRATDEDAWIAKFTQQAVAESHAQRAGGEAMLARMSEMMFVDAVRRYADHLPAQSAGWLAGLRDRFVGRALALMHAQPARDWTLDELGRLVGLSRSALHERFVLMLGMPPIQYLTQWRMQRAARLLIETRDTVATIALEVGYDSEAAFVRAFKRLVGKPPGAWRRERDAHAVA